jgi:drug/metabolite transporter (DMT)-like permease
VAIPLIVAGRLRISRAAAPFLVVGGLAEVAGFTAFAVGARDGISITAVLASQFGAVAAIAAYLLFGERLSRVQRAGVVTIAVGVAVLAAARA